MFEKRLTRFEFTKLVAARYMMLLRGAPPLVKVEGDLVEVAKREILERKLPLTIIRMVSVGGEYKKQHITLEEIEEILEGEELRCSTV